MVHFLWYIFYRAFLVILLLSTSNSLFYNYENILWHFNLLRFILWPKIISFIIYNLAIHEIMNILNDCSTLLISSWSRAMTLSVLLYLHLLFSLVYQFCRERVFIYFWLFICLYLLSFSVSFCIRYLKLYFGLHIYCFDDLSF